METTIKSILAAGPRVGNLATFPCGQYGQASIELCLYDKGGPIAVQLWDEQGPLERLTYNDPGAGIELGENEILVKSEVANSEVGQHALRSGFFDRVAGVTGGHLGGRYVLWKLGEKLIEALHERAEAQTASPACKP